nr:Flp pilus assembly protein CpaB [Pseudomonas sp. C2B4]
MNSRVILGLAELSLVGVVIAGYWGFTLPRQPAAASVAQTGIITPTSTAQASVPKKENTTRQPVVVLLRDITPFVQITTTDAALEKLLTVPAGSLPRLDQAIDRTPWRALSTGSWLSDESFEAGSKLARMIRPDQRALTVALDELINAGGHSPTDNSIFLADGESLVISGLISTPNTSQVNKFPGLGDIPILGAFFLSPRSIAKNGNC